MLRATHQPTCTRCERPQVEVNGQYYGLCFHHLREERDIEAL